MKSIKKLLLLVLIFSVGNSYAIGKNNKIQQARELMQECEVAASETCLDEYLQAQKKHQMPFGYSKKPTKKASDLKDHSPILKSSELNPEHDL